MKVLLAIDNVLADFSRAIAKKLGIEVLPRYDFYEGQCSKEEFYSAMDYEFWATLPLFEHSFRLFELCQELSRGDVTLCTATSGYGVQKLNCMEAKLAWSNKHFKGTEVLFSRNKHEYADKETLLIDDKPTSCSNFVEAGGKAVLWPAHHNGERCSSKQAMAELGLYLKHWHRQGKA